jgi:hypothetical protein
MKRLEWMLTCETGTAQLLRTCSHGPAGLQTSHALLHCQRHAEVEGLRYRDREAYAGDVGVRWCLNGIQGVC